MRLDTNPFTDLVSAVDASSIVCKGLSLFASFTRMIYPDDTEQSSLLLHAE